MDTIPITEGALVKRINRALAHEGRRLRKTRGSNWRLGHFYLIDLEHNFIVDTHADPEDLGRDLGVLRSYEAMRCDQ